MNWLVERDKRYVPSLDGLRALAVLAVIAYHMKAGWASGGLLGVTMFFVLSGYLITGLLLKEYDESGAISLKGFWLRRVRRIIPAVVFAVLGTGLLCTLFDHALLTKMRPDVVPTLLFVNNWWQIFHNVSYFAALGEPSPLTHYWSLAIEEQFYLIWPVALLICLKAGARKDALFKGTIVLAALSVLEMFVLFNPAQDPSRVYYGTDTRAFSLLIGSALAFVWPYQRLGEKAGSSGVPGAESQSAAGGLAGDRMRALADGNLVAFNVLGVGAVVGLLVMVVVTNGFTPFIYRGGLLLCSLLTAIAIAVMVHPASWIGLAFRLKPLVWVGKCSYSMYLWHYPIILIMTPNNMVGDASVLLRLVQLAVIFAVSAFSYYVVEDPIRKGAIGAWVAKVRAGEITPRAWALSHMAPIVAATLFVAIPLVGFAVVPEMNSVSNTAVMDNGSGGTHSSNASSSSGSASSSASGGTTEGDDAKAPAAVDVPPYDILLIGDSVPASTEGYGVFYEEYPYGHIDAVKNRYFGEALDLLRQYKAEGALGEVLVIALGTNGYVTDEEAEAFMAEVGDAQRVWFINTRSQTDFMEDSNASLQRCVDRHANARLIDWYYISGELGEYVFDGDGTHLTIDGCREYVHMIRDAVGSYLPEHQPGEKTRDEALAEAAAHDDGAAAEAEQ